MRRPQANGLLLLAALIWGTAFVAQRHTLAADAAILLSCETLFAALAGRIVLGETMSPTQMIGGVPIFACVLAVQLVPLLRGLRAGPVPA